MLSECAGFVLKIQEDKPLLQAEGAGITGSPAPMRGSERRLHAL